MNGDFDEGQHPRGRAGQFSAKTHSDPGSTMLNDTSQPNVTAAFIQHNIAWVKFDPTPVLSSGHQVMLDSAYTYVENGPRYMLGRGRLIKKDGTVGSRILETNSQVVPASAREAMTALFDDHDDDRE